MKNDKICWDCKLMDICKVFQKYSSCGSVHVDEQQKAEYMKALLKFTSKYCKHYTS